MHYHFKKPYKRMNNDQKDRGKARETRITKENVFKNPGKSKQNPKT